MPVLLVAGTVLSLAFLPLNLGVSDEAIYLYEAKRVLAGQVMYRDIFEIVTPGWVYFMAGVFGLFGTTLAVARSTAAVLHGLTATLVYLTCRRLQIRPGLSWPPALAYVAMGVWAWPVASQHWLATFLFVALLYVLCDPRARPPGRMLRPGVLLGFLLAVQQPRGLAMAAGVVAWSIADAAIRRRYRAGSSWSQLVADLGTLAAGALIVVAPLGVAMIASAGLEPVWRALVVHPLVNYRATNRCGWGYVNVMTAWNGTFTFPRLLASLPAVLPVSALRLVRGWSRRRDQAEVRRVALLLVYCLAAMASIAYYPDFIHIAFIAPAFFVAVAETGEWAVRRLPPSRWIRAAGLVAAVAFLAGVGGHLGENLRRMRATFTVSRETAFGRVDYPNTNPADVALYDRVAEIMREALVRELFVYPILANLYLTVGAENPTPYGFFIAGYSSPDQIQRVVDILEARRVPVVVVLSGFLGKDDAVMRYVGQHYEPVSRADPIGQAIFRRKPDPAR